MTPGSTETSGTTETPGTTETTGISQKSDTTAETGQTGATGEAGKAETGSDKNGENSTTAEGAEGATGAATAVPVLQAVAAAPVAAPAAAPVVTSTGLKEDVTDDTTTIDISNVDNVKISVNDKKQLEVYVNNSQFKKTYTNAGITKVKIQAKDKISFNDQLDPTKNYVLNLAKAIVELLAKQVVLQPNTNVTLKVKELQITAQDTGSTTAGDVFLNVVKKVYDSDCNYVGIKNMTITAENDDDGDSQIVIKATNAVTSNTDAKDAKDGTTADTSETGIWDTVDKKVSDLGSYIASVKNIETIIEIDASTLTADTIDLESVNELKMSTQGVGIGVAVNVASASSMVLVKNSDLTSTKNGIKLLAKSVIESKANAQAKAGNVAVGVSVISGSTEASITGSGTINSKKGLLVSAESNAQATTNAIGKAANDNRSGAFAGVSIVNYDTKANIGGTVSVQANDDVTVKSQQYGINGTTVTSTKKSDDESSSGDKSSSISSILDTVSQSIEQLELKSKLTDNVKTKVKDLFKRDEVEQKVDSSLESADDSEETSGIGDLFESAEAEIANKIQLRFQGIDNSDLNKVTVKITPNEGTSGVDRAATLTSKTYTSEQFAEGSYTLSILVPAGYAVPDSQVIKVVNGKGYTGTVTLSKTNRTKNQFVGAFAVMVVNSRNEASITTTGTISTNGKVQVLANAVSNNTTVADASTIPADLDREAKDNEVVVAIVTEDKTTTLPAKVSLTKLYGNSDLVVDAIHPYDQNYLKDKSGMISFQNGATQNDKGQSNGKPQSLSEGRYKLVFKVPVSLGFTPKDVTVANTGKQVTIESTNYYVYTMYITLSKKAGSEDLEGLKQLILMKANTTDTGSTGTKVSAGVGIGVNVIKNENTAYIKNATIEASGVDVKATTGGYEVTTTTTEGGETKTATKKYDNRSDVSSAAGFNSGEFGFGGAISVNVVNDVTTAYIDGAKITIKDNGGTNNINIEATSKNDSHTTAGKEKDENNTYSSNVGVGSGIAVGVGNYTTTADLGSDVTITGTTNQEIGSVTIKATSEGEVNVEAIAGVAGGKAVAPVIAVNIVNGTTRAKAAANTSNMLALTGDMTVYARSDRKRRTTANASAAGSKVAVGGAITVAAGNLHQYAYMERGISKSRNISVKAESGNSTETVSIAGANGAAAPKDDEDSSGSSEDSDSQSSKSSPDALVNKALASGKKVGSGTDGIGETPSKSPQKAETTEGKVTVAAAIAVDIWGDETKAVVTGNTTSSGKLEVLANAANTAKVTANASSTLSTTGVGVSVAILVGDLINKAELSGTHKTGYFLVKAGMVKDGENDRVNDIQVISISGAGASNVGVAGAVAINIFDTEYAATQNGTLIATNAAQTSEVTANVNQKVVTRAGASADLAGAGSSTSTGTGTSAGTGTSGTGTSGSSKKSVGVGASFALTIADAKADAVVNGTIQTVGNLQIEGIVISDVETKAVAGNDAYEEPAEDGKIKITVKNSDGEAVKDATVTITVDGNTKTQKTNESGQVILDSVTKDKEYTITITAVPNGYTVPGDKVTFTLTADDTGYAKTFVLAKTNQKEKDKYASLDAAVAAALITNRAHAEASKTSNVTTGKDFRLHAESTSVTNVISEGEAEASNVAVGASVAVNLVAEEVKALMAGTASVGGDFSVTAKAQPKDLASAYATASGLDLQRYKDKYNTTISDILSGKAFKKDTTGTSGSGSTGSSEGTTSQVNQKVDEQLNKSNTTENTNHTNTKPEATKEGTSLSSKVLNAADVKTSENSANTGSTGTTGDGAASADQAKKDATATTNPTGTKTEKQTNVSVAAAVGTSIVSHKVSAEVTGQVTKAKNVTIKAENLDNFETLATGAAVSKKTSIALGVAVVVNNSKTYAAVMKNLGTSTEKVGDVTIQAVTKHNTDQEYLTKLGAQAIAGAANGSEKGGAAVAGAVALIVSNAQTNALIGPKAEIYANGDVTVEATEQSKLAARAWGATLTSSKFNEQNNAAGTGAGQTAGTTAGGAASGTAGSSSGAGVGAAIAMIYAYDQTKAEIGDSARIEANSLTVNAQKQEVKINAADGIKNIEINGVISTGATQIQDGKIKINTTDNAQSDKKIEVSDLADVALNLWNLLANKNYYLEAVGGSAADTAPTFTGAGSFTVLVAQDTVEALVGKNVVLVLTDGLTVTAASKVNAVTIAGSVAYGGSKSAGIGVNTIVNDTAVRAELGDNTNVTVDNGDVLISADGDLNLVSVLVAASVSSTKTGSTSGTQAAGEGVVNIFINDNKAIAKAGDAVVIYAPRGNVTVKAASKIGYTGIVGGLAKSGGHGIGASVSVLVVNNEILAQTGNGVTITAGQKIHVDADSKETIVAVVVNGAAATGANSGVAVAVSPSVNVIKGSTQAIAGTGTYTANFMDVTADSTTKIVILSGGAAVSAGKAGVGGSVQVDVFLKKVRALIADGTEGTHAVIFAPGGLTVSANSKEDSYLFVIGLGGGKSAAVSGSIAVVVIDNEVEAKIGNYAKVGSENSRGDVTVSAKDDMVTVVLAGGVAASTSGAAVGLANADVIASGSTKAQIGDHVTVYGNNVTVTATSDKKFINVVISGGVSNGSAAVAGSAAVVVVGDTVKAAIGDNAVINANGDVKVIALGSTDIIDIVGNLGISGGSVAVGASIDTIVYQGTVYAGIGKGTQITTSNSGNVIVSAKSNDKLIDLVIGVGVSSGSAAVNGSVAVIVAKQNVFALIGTPDSNNKYADAAETRIQADGSVQVTAEAEQLILSGAGSAAISLGTAGVGAGIIVVTDTHRAWAEAGKGAEINALGKKPVTGNFGKLVTSGTSGNVTYKNGKHDQMTINGVIIGAFNTTNLHTIAVTGSGGSTAGVGIATVTVVEKARSQAVINDNAKINQGSRTGAHQQSSVHVIASNDTVESVSGGAASGGGTAGVSGAVVVYTGIKETTARIGDGAQVKAENAIVVLAHSDNQIYANVVGAAVGGTAGVGGSVSVIVLQDTTTASVGGSLIANAITVKAESNELLELSATAFQAAGTAAVGASVGTIVFKGKTFAIVRPGTTLTAANGDIIVYADSKEKVIMTVLGGGAGGTAAVNGSFAVLVMNVTTQAKVEDGTSGNGSSLSAAKGSVTVKATDTTDLNLNTGNVVGGGAAAVGAAIEVAVYRNTVTAMIGNYNTVTAKSILVQAIADRDIQAAAVMASASGTASINGSILVLSIGAGTTDPDANKAETNGGGNSSDKASKEASDRGQAAVNLGYGQKVNAEQGNQYVTEANGTISGLATDNKNLISGYFTSANVEDKTYAGIGDGGKTTATDGDVIVEATEKTKLDAIAGAASGSGTVSVGISMNLAIINGTAEARLGGTVKADKGNVKVHAQNILNIPNFISSGGGVSGSASVAGTISVIKVGEKATAYIAPNAKVYADGNVIALAESAQDIRVINGSVSGGGVAGVGVATNVIIFSNKTHAYVGGGATVTANANKGNVNFVDGTTTSKVDSNYENLNDKNTKTDYVSSKSNESAQSGVLVGAKSSQKIRSWVVSGAASGAVSVVGSVNVLTFGSETKAWIGKNAKVTTKNNGDILVIAVDTTSIQDVAGNIAASGTVSAGISNDTITFQKVTSAYVDEGAVLTSGRNIIIKAISDEAYVVVVVSAGAAVGATPTGAVNGAVSTIVIKNETTAEVKANTAATILTANGSIAIWAEDNQNLYVIAGSANTAISATGVSVSGAAGVAVVKASNKVQALVGKLAQLDAYGTTGINFYTGELDGNDGGRERKRKKAKQYGVLIGAFNTNNLMAITASGSAGTGAAGAIASTTVVSKTEVRAKAEQGAQINQKVKANREQKTSASSVKVIAMDSTEVDTAAGGAAVGIAGATGTIVVTHLKKTVEAILNGTVYAPGGVDVLAISDNNVFLLTTSLAGGLAGGAGSASVLYTENTITSQLGGTIETGTAAVNVKAINRQYITSGAASVAAGITAVGGAGASIIFKSHTKAEVLNGTTITAGSLNVTAQSKETITGVVAAATGGSTAVGGSLILIIANADTTARIGNNVTINLSGDLTVQAEDIVTIDMTAGTVSGGGAAVGGAAAVLIFKNTVLAEIGTNGKITAANLNLTANSKRNITSYVAAGSGGVGAVSGSVLVILVGSKQSDDAKTAMKRDDTNDVSSNSQKSINEALNNANGLTGENLKLDIKGYFTGETANATTARIGSGTVLTLTGDAKINAAETTTVTAYVGSVSVGALVAGGAVAIAILNGTVQAEINGTINASGTVTINAENQITSNAFKAVVGSGGVIGLGAAVAYMDVTGTTKVLIGSTGSVNGNGTSGVNVSARLIINTNPTADGYGVGWASAGMAAARLKVTGTTIVEALSGSGLASANGNVKLNAYQNITSTATTKAANVGYGATGSVTLALVEVGSTTKVASGANVTASNGTYDILAHSILTATANAYGLSAALGGSVQAAIARLTVKPVVLASVTGGQIQAKNIRVRALFNVNDNNSYNKAGNLESNAYAGAAGGLVSGSGASSEITVDGSATAEVTNATLTLAEDALVLSKVNGSLTGNGAGLAAAGGAAVGGVVVKISNTFETIARITRTIITAARNVTVLADYDGTVNGTAKGTAGGLLVAGTAQSLSMTENITTTANIAGNSKIDATGTVSVLAQDEHQVVGKATGYSVAGFASGGLTKITTKIINKTTAGVNGSTVTAQNILIKAGTAIKKDTTATASSGALGGSANDVSDNTTVSNQTYAEVGSGSKLTATDNNLDDNAIVIIAESDNSYKGYATAIAGAIIAKGVASAIQTVTDDVRVRISPSTIIAQQGNIVIHASAKDITSNLTAYGGAGGVAAGTNVKAEAVTNANAIVEFIDGSSGNHASVNAKTGDTTIGTETDTEARVYGKIKFTVDGLSSISTDVKNTMRINSKIDLGSYTEVSAAKNLDIQALIKRIYAYASAYSETGSVINTQSKPNATVDVTAYATVTGTGVKLHAGERLTLYAISTNDIYTNAYSYGYTAGGTGSVISTATNNTGIYGNVEIKDSSSSMNARDIAIGAATKSEREVSYTKKAEYKAVTVTEFIKKTVTKTKNVIEKVSAKICKKLPWPLNKIVKWITKTIVKVITWVEEIVVEKILQSETEKYENGSYSSTNNVILNGDIYYGSNAAVDIIIDEQGNIANKDVTYETTDNDVKIKTFSSKANGSLKIESAYGKVSGNVKVHSNNVITKLNITNNSAKNLILKNIDLLAEYDPESCAYTILCSDYSGFVMEDVVDNMAQPEVTITTNTGKNVTFDGLFSYYTAILNVLFNGTKGNVYFGENAKLDVSKLNIQNADNVGMDGNPLHVNLFVAKDNNNNLKRPELIIDAAGNVYLQAGLKRYVEVQGTTSAQAKALADAEAAKISNVDRALIQSIKGKKIHLILDLPKLVVGVLVEDPVTGAYKYTTTESVSTALNIVVTSSKTETQITDTLYEKTELDAASGEWKTRYYTDSACMNQYQVAAGKHVEERYDTEGFEYYLVTTVADDQVTYQKLDQPAEYLKDADGNPTGQVKVKIGGTEQTITLGSTNGIQYLKKLEDGTYTEEISKNYWLVDDEVTLLYKPAPGSTDENQYDEIRYNKNTKKYEVVKAGQVLKQYDYISYDETSSQYVGVTVTTVEKEQDVTGMTEGKTVEFEYDNLGTYNLNTITAENDVKILAPGTEVNLTGTIMAGTDLTLTADTVTREGSQNIDLKAAGMKLQVTKSFGTAATPIRVSVGERGLSTTDLNTGSIYLAAKERDLGIGSIISDSVVEIRADHVVKAVTFETNIKAAALRILKSSAIGTKEQNLRTEISGNMEMISAGDIYATELGTANVKNIRSTKNEGKVSLTAAGMVNCAEGGSAAITADNITLHATAGSIGSSAKAMDVEVGSGTLNAVADRGSLYLTDLTGNVMLGQLQAVDKIVFKAAGSISGKTSAAGMAAVTAANAEITSINGNIGMKVQPLKTKVSSMTASAAKGSIFLDNTEKSGYLALVDIKAKEDIQIKANSLTGTAAGDEPEVTGRNLKLTAVNGDIGTAERALKVKADTLDADAAKNIWMKSIGSTTVNHLTAPESIQFTATDKMTAGAIAANEVHVTTKKLDITAKQIAEDTNYLKVKGYGSDAELELQAKAKTGVYIQDNSKTLKLKKVSSDSNDVKIKTTGAMVNGLDDTTANVTAKNIVLEADTVGTDEKALTTNLIVDKSLPSENNALIVKAKGNINLHDIGTEGILPITEMSSTNGDISFRAERSTAIETIKAENGSITSRVNGDYSMNNLKAGKMVNIYATGKITGNVDGNLTIGHVEAGSVGDRKDITLTINNGNLLSGLESTETDQTNLTGKDITLNATGKTADGTGNLGTAGKWLVLETEGQLKADTAGNMWLKDIRLQKPEEGTWKVGHLVSGSKAGEIHLKSARDTAIDELIAGMIDLDIDGMADVTSSGSLNGTIKSKGLNLKADSIGAKADESEEGSKDQYLDIDAGGKKITISAEHDIYANEINQESGLTVIDSLSSANGNISLKTAQDTEIGSMKAENGAGMAETVGNLTIKELTAKTADITATATLEIAEIIADSLKAAAGELLKVATSKDLHAKLLQAERVEAEAAGEMVIDELLTGHAKLTAGRNADVTTSGDLSAGTIEAANIRLKAAGDLGTREEALMLKTGDRVEAEAGGLINIQETSTEPGKTTITAKSDKDDVTVETNRDLVLEDTQGQNVNVTTGGRLEAKNIEAAENGRLYMEAEKDIVINNDAQSVFGRLVSRTGGIDLTQAGNIVVESLAAAGIVNMKTDDFIKVIAESILYLGTWTADQLIEITSQYDILNGLNVATACNATAETVRMNTSGNIGSAEKSVRTKAENGGFKAENLYLDNDGSLKLENTEIGKDADLTVNGDLTNEDAVLKAEKLHVKAEHADLTTDVDEIAGEVGESIAIRNQKDMKVTEQLTAGKEVSIETPGGTIEVSGIIASPRTILKGADHIIVRVTDKIGELDVETTEKKETGEENTDETLDQPSVDLTMESSKDNQQIHVTTPGSFKMTTTEADEIIRFFGDRIRLQGGTNDAEIWFNLAPGTVEAIVPGGNNLIDIVTTMAPTTITTGSGDDTFILGGPVEDEKDAAYKFHENGITGEEEGYLGAGNQHELRISTESGTNTWHLWMSGTDFYLEGGMGDDTYIRHGFTYEDRDGNIGYFATNHYHITDKGGYNTYIGFPVEREEKDRKHDPEAGLKGRWIQTADGNWMFKMDDGFAKSMWVKVGQKWWYMNEEGYMHTGWLLYNNQWYYLIPGEGSMHMGWILINGIWYYLNPVYQEGRPQGSMYCNEYTPDGYFVGADGAWIPSIPRYLGQKTA